MSKDAKDLLALNQTNIVNLLGTNQDSEKFLTIARKMISDKLSACEPRSVFDAICTVASLGLSPEPSLGLCYIIPYGSKAQFQIGYKGLIQLAYESGFETVGYGTIHENDEFEENGLGQLPTFRKARTNRGKLQGAFYACKNIATGLISYDVLWEDEINQRRAKSKTANQPSSPWNTDPDSMYLKTVIKYHLSKKPVGKKVRDALVSEEIIEEKDITPTENPFITELRSKLSIIQGTESEESERDFLRKDLEEQKEFLEESVYNLAKQILS